MVSRLEQTPVLATSFQTDILDTGAIHDELNRLWVELGGPTHGGQATGEIGDEPHFGGGLMRANTLNLLAVARNERDAGLITATRRGVWVYYAVDPAGIGDLEQSLIELTRPAGIGALAG